MPIMLKTFGNILFREKKILPPWDRRFFLCLLAVNLMGLGGLLWIYGTQDWYISWQLIPLINSIFCTLNLLFIKVPLRPYDRIFSAFSTDGFTWKQETGVRIDVGGLNESCMVYSPCVVPYGKQWRMFYRGGGYQSSIVSATSKDGLVWKEEEGVRIRGQYPFCRVDFPSVVCWPDGTWRMFFAASDGKRWKIFRSKSDDMLLWKEEDYEEVKVELESSMKKVNDPFVIRWLDRWRMYFSAFDNEEIRFFTVLSNDGEKWGKVEECKGFESGEYNIRNAVVVPAEEGSWRMYFSQYGSSIIGSGIVSAVSKDGINWKKEEGSRIKAGGRGAEHGVFCPYIVRVPEGFRMYYGGYWGAHWGQLLTLYQHRTKKICSVSQIPQNPKKK